MRTATLLLLILLTTKPPNSALENEPLSPGRQVRSEPADRQVGSSEQAYNFPIEKAARIRIVVRRVVDL